MRALKAWLLKGAPSRPGKTSADPAKLTPPPRRSRTPFTLSRKANHSSSESDNSLVIGRSRNEPPLTWREASRNSHPARLADEPIHCEPSLLMKPAAGKKERGREVIRSASLPSSPRRKPSSGTQEWRRHAMRRRRSRRFFPAPNFGKVDAIMVRDEQQLAEVREKLTNNNFR